MSFNIHLKNIFLQCSIKTGHSPQWDLAQLQEPQQHKSGRSVQDSWIFLDTLPPSPPPSPTSHCHPHKCPSKQPWCQNAQWRFPLLSQRPRFSMTPRPVPGYLDAVNRWSYLSCAHRLFSFFAPWRCYQLMVCCQCVRLLCGLQQGVFRGWISLQQ